MPKVLTRQQALQYEQNGFLSPLTIMAAEDAERLRTELETAEARWPQALRGTGRNNAHLSLTCLDRIVHHSVILDAVEDLIGHDIMVSATVLFIKEPSSPGYVSWHQDATYMGLEPHVGVTAWFALSESDTQLGCMRMIPGSHNSDIRTHIDTYADSNILTRGQTITDVDESNAVDLILQPGQISLHHMRTIHGSQPNQGRQRRIGLAIQSYIPPSVRQTVGAAYAQMARGTDTGGNFHIAPRPASDMEATAVETRRRANKLLADTLYHHAKKRRNY